jgi:DNA-binding MarR family transcriptional regulator
MKCSRPSTRHLQAISQVLRTLERKGLIESRLDPEGNVRWHVTEKGRHVTPEEVHIGKEFLN